MKVTTSRNYRGLLTAGCLVAAAAISGFSLFAQAPGGGPGVPAQPGTSGAPGQSGAAPSVTEGATELPLTPSAGFRAPAAGNPEAGTGEPGRGAAAAPGAGNSLGGAPPPSSAPGFGASGLGGSAFGAPGGGGPPRASTVGPNTVGQGGGVPGKGPARGRSGFTPAGKGQGMPGMSGPTGSMSGGMMGGGGPMMGGMGMMPGAGGQMSVSPEMALDHEIKTALKAYRTHAAEPEVRAELVKTISNHITEQFKIRQDRREAEIKAIETELARVKHLHESRVANQEAIIASRLKELLSTADGLGWDLPDDSQTPAAGGIGPTGVIGAGGM